MRIIGCDLHARQQTLAILDTTTGEMVNLTLMHEGNEVREFYSQLPRPVLVGIGATGPNAVVSEPHGRVGDRMPGWPSRHDSRGRASTADNVHSGFIAPAAHERNGVPQAHAPVAQVQPPVGVTPFRVAYMTPGTHPYICAFHNELGMKGEVIVLP
jgi:hypothetical protein